MKLQARLQTTSAPDQRESPRRRLCLGSNLKATGEKVVIHDLSSTGMLIETAANLAPFDSLEIELPEAGLAQALVIWNSGRYFGCEFKNRLSRAAVSASRLRSLPNAPDDRLETFSAASVDAPLIKEEWAEKFEGFNHVDEEKAPLGVRLRVILGSAIILWAMIIWAAVSLVRLARQ